MNIYEVKSRLANGELLSNLKLRVTYYARVSTDNCLQLNSLYNQSSSFIEYIKSNSNWIYVKGYVDEGISGVSDIKRKNFMKMVSDAKDNMFDLIITKEISRFSRNTLDSIKYSRKLLSYGVAIYFVSDNINTLLPDSELRLTIMASLAQDEIRRLSERIKFGMKRAIKNGKILGNNRLYGYDIVNKNFTIVNDEAEVIRNIFNLYVNDKLSLSRISKLLNNTTIGRRWTTTSISRVITNPKYKGYYCGHKREVIDYMSKKVRCVNEDEWVMYKDSRIPPIVSSDIWDYANKRLRDRKRISTKTCKYVYSSFIYCGYCCGVFYHRITRRGSKDISWICSNRLKGKCLNNTIYESELNKILIDLFYSMNIDIKKSTKIFSNIDNIYRYLDRAIIHFMSKEIVKRVIVYYKDDIIYLDIILFVSIELDSKNKKYIFKRGYDTISTKRYNAIYYVNYIFS